VVGPQASLRRVTNGSSGDRLVQRIWTPEQLGIIKHREGPLQILACAGAGKTTTVARMIAETIGEGESKESIVAFTFTDKAADELKLRIREQLEEVCPDDPSLGGMFVGTIHSFCWQRILIDNFPEYRDFGVLEDAGSAALIMRKLRGIRPDEVQWYKDAFDTVRRELMDVEDLEEPLRGYFARYRELMRENRFFDYAEMQYMAIKHLREDRGLREKIQNKYERVIVDEYQDINKIQEELIKIISEPQGNLCVVGDDDQAVYKWRGARIENFLKFKDRYKGAEVKTLSKNFRSTDIIIEAANSLIQGNRDRLSKSMFTDTKGEVGDVYKLSFERQGGELDFIVNRIRRLEGSEYRDSDGRSRRITFGDMAFLFRVKKAMRPFIRRLEEDGIPYTVKGSSQIFLKPEIDYVRWALSYLAEGTGRRLMVPLSGDASERARPTEENVRNVIRSSRLLRGRENDIIERLREIRRRKITFPIWRKTLSREEFEKRLRGAGIKERDVSRRIFPQTIFQEILKTAGIKEWGPDPGNEPVMYDLGVISGVLKQFEQVYPMVFPDQIWDLSIFLNEWALGNARGDIEDPTLRHAVRILTMHSAKGLEYPAVFLPDLSKHQMPTRQRGRPRLRFEDYVRGEEVYDPTDYEEGEEDERRLFYVAVTRSRKFLTVTHSYSVPSRSRRYNPSQYFEELTHEYIVMEPVEFPPAAPPGPAGEAEVPAYPTSFSDLSYYLRCPYDYWLRKILNFNPPIDSGFDYGQQLHKILRNLHEEYKDSLLPHPSKAKEEAERQFRLRHASGEVEENLRRDAAEVIYDYVKGYRERFPLVFKAEEPFEMVIGYALVSGQVDLLEKIDPRTKEVLEVNLIDFKATELPTSDWNPKWRDAKFQLRLYALATKRSLGLRPVTGWVHSLKDRKRHEVDIGEGMQLQAERLVRQTVERILERRFPIKPMDKQGCVGCDWKNVCPGAG